MNEKDNNFLCVICEEKIVSFKNFANALKYFCEQCFLIQWI